MRTFKIVRAVLLLLLAAAFAVHAVLSTMDREAEWLATAIEAVIAVVLACLGLWSIPRESEEEKQLRGLRKMAKEKTEQSKEVARQGEIRAEIEHLKKELGEEE